MAYEQLAKRQHDLSSRQHGSVALLAQLSETSPSDLIAGVTPRIGTRRYYGHVWAIENGWDGHAGIVEQSIENYT